MGCNYSRQYSEAVDKTGKTIERARRSVDKCFKPADFSKIVDCNLRHLADACEYSHRQASYLHIVNETGENPLLLSDWKV